MTTSKRILKNIQISENWLDILALIPGLTDHGNAWAIESLIADRVGLVRPRTPAEARKAGAIARGKQLAGKPALNKINPQNQK